MANALIDGLWRDLDARRDAGLWRVRRTVESAQGPRIVVEGRELLAFASNDYLGLAGDAGVGEAAVAAISRWGVGAGASHLVCGHQSPHDAAEAALAAYTQPCDDARALLFTSGYLANLAILTALAGRSTTVYADRLNHACLNDGALLARAKLVRYPHRDVDALEARLREDRGARRIIATDAVFSMDGTVAPLARLLELADRYDAWLVVDDAHGFGVTGGGRGTLAEAGLASDRLVLMATLGKAAGVAGAFVAAHPAVVETIVQTARPYIYTTAAPAVLACATLRALDAIRAADDKRAHLFAMIARFRAALGDGPLALGTSALPIQPVIVGANEAAMSLSNRLWSRRIFVPAIRPPTVPAGTARLRVSISAAHRAADVDELVGALNG